MKYQLTLEIAVPREELARLYVDPKNWPSWQKNLVSYEVVSGENREAGSKIRLVNRFGKKEIEILETVEANDLPDVYTCTYEAPGAWNRVVNRFTPIGSDRTRWEFDSEFDCRGMLRIMSLLMPGMFRRSSLQEMQAFKTFAEGSVHRG